MNPRKVIFAAYKYDYGKPEQGLSFEACNFLDTLNNMKGTEIDVVELAVDERIAQVGRDGLNRELLELAKREKPSVLFAVPFKDELDGEAVREMARLGVTTIAWFSDDHWRFDSFTRRQAPYYQWSVTTDSRAVAKYRRIGCNNVIRSQWACNHFSYRPVREGSPLNVSFVGQPHGNRPQIVESLGHEGIAVDCWGQGWPAGRISQEGMMRVFTQSKINLNLTNASGVIDLKSMARCVLERLPDRRLRLRSPRRMWEVLTELIGKTREQIKGRHFEIPGCAGFQLSGPADDLENYYSDGKEIAIYGNLKELVEKTRYYLSHDEERMRIAEAGYRRTMAEHTYENRFKEIFRKIGVIS